MVSVECSPFRSGQHIRSVRLCISFEKKSAKNQVLLAIYPGLMDWDRDTQMFYIAGLFGMMLDWHVRGFDNSVEEISRSLLKLLSKPLHPYG